LMPNEGDFIDFQRLSFYEFVAQVAH